MRRLLRWPRSCLHRHAEVGADTRGGASIGETRQSVTSASPSIGRNGRCHFPGLETSLPASRKGQLARAAW